MSDSIELHQFQGQGATVVLRISDIFSIKERTYYRNGVRILTYSEIELYDGTYHTVSESPVEIFSMERSAAYEENN